MAMHPAVVEDGLKHLHRSDPVLSRVIEQAGPFKLRTEPNAFRLLVRSIVSQQISTGAARSIHQRLLDLVAPARLTPERLAALTPEQLRSAGLSSQKIRYLSDLARRVVAGEVPLRGLARKPDEEIIAELVQVKGIGVWTAQMFLIFSLGRPDVFPHDDLGVRSALRNLHGLGELPDKESCLRLAAPWRPYATIASWYCWRSLEFPKTSPSA